jgi:uncharacterized protein (DUF302 family)
MNILFSRRKVLATGAIGVAARAAAHAAGEPTMSQASMSKVSVTSRTIPVEHIRISSQRPFAEVRRKLEASVPQLDPSIAEALARGDQKRMQDYDENGPKLSIFLTREHGALLQIAGGRQNAVQYEIGNPLTATKMTRHRLPAALYAPLRVVLVEDEQGRGIFEYDKPSSLFGQFGDDRVTEVGRYLDAALEAALRNAAE